MDEKLDLNAVLDVLADAHRLFLFESHWSNKEHATKNGVPCDPADADAWSGLGAVEKILLTRGQYKHLAQVVSELEQDCEEALCSFDETHSHRELIELWYSTMGRIAEQLKLNMYAPLFPATEEEFNAEEDMSILFIPKEFDDQLEQSHRDSEARMEESLRKDRADAWFAASLHRDDE